MFLRSHIQYTKNMFFVPKLHIQVGLIDRMMHKWLEDDIPKDMSQR